MLVWFTIILISLKEWTYPTQLVDGLTQPPNTVRNVFQGIHNSIEEFRGDILQVFQTSFNDFFHLFVLQGFLHCDTVSLVVNYVMNGAVHFDRIHL